MSKIVKLWLSLISAHIVLAVIPSAIWENKVTAFIPYNSVFTPLEIFKLLDIPVYGHVSEDMFMTPITVIGWCLVFASWLLIHFGLALTLSHLIG